MFRRVLLAAPIAAMIVSGPAAAQDRGALQRQDTFRDAAMAPLEDLNLKQTDIPAVLRRAVADPYDVEGLDRCEAIAAEVGRIDAALGPDLDEAPPPDERGRVRKVADDVREAGVSEVRGRTEGLLPFRGWIRKLTGAARHEKAVQQAVRSGAIRRGYLKGVGMRMNCAPPAAPSWFVPEKPAVQVSGLAAFWAALVAWLRSWWPF